MDYCSTCRRNLNGALVCPGCGAYAPDIAPPAHRLHNAVASDATVREAWRAEQVPAPEFHPGTRHAGAAPVGSGASEDAMTEGSSTESSAGSAGSSVPSSSSGDFEDTAPALQGGRAARRRQLARWKKNRRRALTATAVALVGGGLTVAALPATRPSASHTHAASPPEPVTTATPWTAPTGGATEQPDSQASRHTSTRPPVTTSGRQNSTVAEPPGATTVRQAKAAAAAQPPAPRSATRPTAAEPAKGTNVGNAAAPAAPAAAPPAPATTAPASTEAPGAGTSAPLNLLPTTPPAGPTSPAHVCLIGVCIG
ncbi:SCO2400 family protein [Streptomyces sp. NPDC054841]